MHCHAKAGCLLSLKATSVRHSRLVQYMRPIKGLAASPTASEVDLCRGVRHMFKAFLAESSAVDRA